MSFLKTTSTSKLKVLSNSKLLIKPFIVRSTYSLFADKNTINEGETVTFTLTTTSVEQETVIPFTAFGLGITQDDFIEGNLSDNFIINNNAASYTFKAKNDATTEGDETMIVALTDFPSISTSVLILDTSKAPPAYNVTAPASVSEGTTITFTISTIGVPNGSIIPYTISGSASSLDFDIGGTGDINGGNVTIIADNQVVPLGFATVTFNVKNDVLTEGTENIVLTIPVNTLPIQLQPDPLVDVSATVSIIDISVTPFPPETVLYLAGDGPNNSNNNVFVDSSSNNFAVTRNGSVTQGSFSPFPLNGATYNPVVHGGSAYFEGNNVTSYLTIPINAFNFGTDNFTVEFWINPTLQASYNAGRDFSIIGGEYGGSGVMWGVYVTSYAGYRGLTFGYGLYGSYTVGIHTNNWLTANQWQHVAITRQGTTWGIFVNGVAQTLSIYGENGAAWNPSFNFLNSTVTTSKIGVIGHLNPFYLSDVRFTKGAALYASNFTSPTAPLTLTSNGGGGGTAPTASQVSLLCNFTNSSIIDSAGKNNLAIFGNTSINTTTKKNGTGSLYFDGNGDYLTTPNNTNFNFETGDFTIEAWVNFNTIGSSSQIICGAWWSTTNTGWQLYYRGLEQKITFYINNGVVVQSTASLIAQQWHHIAVSRQSSTLTLFVDGIGTSVTNTTNITTTNPNLEIGYQSTGTTRSYINGYIDDLQITKGLAKYTSNFTPV